jgi:toxin ParE1/3/4
MAIRPKYLLSRKAKADLEAIWLYGFERWSLKQADMYVAGLYDCFEMIGRMPHLGRKAFHLRAELLRFEHDSHTIFYIHKKRTVLVIRILHGKMDPERHL